MRTCVVAIENGELPAYFHQWISESTVILKIPYSVRSSSREVMMMKSVQLYEDKKIIDGGLDAVPIQETVGLVEFEDGTIGKVDAKKIRFTDHDNNLNWGLLPHEEKLKQLFDWRNELPVSTTLQESFEKGALYEFTKRWGISFRVFYDRAEEVYIDPIFQNGIMVTFNYNTRSCKLIVNSDDLNVSLRTTECDLIESAAIELGINLDDWR